MWTIHHALYITLCCLMSTQSTNKIDQVVDPGFIRVEYLVSSTTHEIDHPNCSSIDPTSQLCANLIDRGNQPGGQSILVGLCICIFFDILSHPPFLLGSFTPRLLQYLKRNKCNAKAWNHFQDSKIQTKLYGTENK